MPITSLAEMLVDISYAQVENSTSTQNIVLPFHPRVFLGIVFIHREAMAKEVDS
jgi:hypothetical protein